MRVRGAKKRAWKSTSKSVCVCKPGVICAMTLYLMSQTEQCAKEKHHRMNDTIEDPRSQTSVCEEVPLHTRNKNPNKHVHVHNHITKCACTHTRQHTHSIRYQAEPRADGPMWYYIFITDHHSRDTCTRTRQHANATSSYSAHMHAHSASSPSWGRHRPAACAWRAARQCRARRSPRTVAAVTWTVYWKVPISGNEYLRLAINSTALPSSSCC